MIQILKFSHNLKIGQKYENWSIIWANSNAQVRLNYKTYQENNIDRGRCEYQTYQYNTIAQSKLNYEF